MISDRSKRILNIALTDKEASDDISSSLNAAVTQDDLDLLQNNIDALSSSLDGLANYSAGRIRYVDKSGSDSNSGGPTSPFLTIKAAIDSITDADSNNRYALLIGPGVYSELSSITLKPYIDITSRAPDTVSIDLQSNATLKWSNSLPGRVAIQNVGISHGIEVLNDDPMSPNGCALDLDNVDIGSLVFFGRGGGIDYCQLRNDVRVANACTIHSASVTIFDCTLIGTLTMSDLGCQFPDGYGSAITASLRSNYELNVSISSTNYDVYTDAWGNNSISSLTMVSNSAYPCTFNADPSSYPNSMSLSGSPSPVVNRSSEAKSIEYSADATKWTAPAPTSVKEDLDRMAALLKTLNGGSSIP